MKRKLLVFLFLAPLLFAERYALILTDAPAAGGARTRIQAAQTTVRRELASRQVPVTGAVQRILNAVFVQAAPDRVDELRAIPGVQAVVRMRRRTLKLNAAVQLVNAPAAWNALGGTGNAGAGVKIAIIDSGIDQNHPAFQDASLQFPPGFPVCRGGDCAFTNSKVIVARSYIAQVGAGTPPNPAVDSRPDDNSPRDHIGHGTAVAMIAGGNTNTGPAATITGMAPKAWLGNYKIFGSPGVNDGTTSDVIIQALEDALNDGMNVAVLSLGGPALSGPTDVGAACGQTGNAPCDPEAAAIESVIAQGLTVIAAGGNEGDLGDTLPTQSTVDAPGYGPSVIAVGATTNSHVFINSVRVPGSGVPPALAQIPAIFGDGPMPPAPVTAPVRDVTQLGDDGTACSALPRNSLTGAFALIQRGVCNFSQKVGNAQQAGADGVIMYLQPGQTQLFSPSGLRSIVLPVVMIGYNAGTALKAYVDAHPEAPATIDPNLAPADVATYNEVTSFSSRGPSTGNGALKPDLVAVGTDLYMATERYDPDGEMYDATGYTVQDGTSFSTPMVAGGIALVKQRNPGFTPAQLKSAVMNTATQDVTDNGGPAPVTAVGAGKLDAGKAVATTVTVQPASLSFGVIGGSTLPAGIRLTVTNAGASGVTLNLALQQGTRDTLGRLSIDRSTLTLAAGASGTVTVTLGGTMPQPGNYEGALVIQGGAVPLRVPYLYTVPDGVPYNIFPLFGYSVSGTVNEENPDGGVAFQLIDRYGVGVSGVPVRFTVTRGGGRITNADSATDRYGIAGAAHIFGSGSTQQVTATAGGLTVTFDGSARPKPAISSGGVVNAASFAPGAAPGAYISIFGNGLSDTTEAETTPALPVDLATVSVSFDVPSAGISVPGRLYYVSPRQVNVQVPWELAGQSSAQMKVNVERSNGQLTTVALSTYAPAVFEYQSGSTSYAAALDLSGKLIAPSNPARRGQVIQIYCNGLGPVDNQPPSGEPAPANPLARTTTPATVTIGQRPAAVSFSGLAPGFAGLYQLNVTVPADAPTGVQPLALSIGGVTAKTSSIAVQ